MNLIFSHSEYNCNPFSTNKVYNELYVYEQKPQKRILRVRQFNNYFENNKTFNYNFKKIIQVELPYLYFCFNVKKLTLSDGDAQREIFIYGGEPESAFQVFASKTPITSVFNDEVDLLMFETIFLGTICTNHNYDRSNWNSIEELAQWAVSEWYSQEQYVDADNYNYANKTNLVLGEHLSIDQTIDKLKDLWENNLNNNFIVDMKEIWEKSRFHTFNPHIKLPKEKTIVNAIKYIYNTKYLPYYKELN